jgi:hypothetical protein
MRVLVCGDRDFLDGDRMAFILNAYPITELIEGEARGADTQARLYAERRRIPLLKFPADWKRYGRMAGPIRNKQMLDEGKPELVIAFLAPHSKGTRDMIDQAERANIPVVVINI